MFVQNILGCAQRASKIDFGGVLGTLLEPFGGPFRHFGVALALLGHCLGPNWRQNRHDEGLKSELGSDRGGQGVLRGSQCIDFEEIFIACCVLLGTFACCVFKKGFVHHGCSVALQLLFAMC